jgi:hypothetical protein
MEEARDCVSQRVHPGYEGFSIHHKVQEDFSANKNNNLVGKASSKINYYGI